MKRPGNRRTYDRLLANIRNRVPGVALRTTFIVGFPGESESDFTELCNFVRDTEFDHVGVFTYSHEEGTSAYSLGDPVPASVKRRRQKAVMALQKKLVVRAQRRRIGEAVRVCIDGPSAEHELVAQGRLASQAPEIDPVVYLTDADPGDYPPGTFFDGQIVGARGYDLVVRPLS
jgi:ribosomal protein S12 methylthiotransferase